MKFCLSIFAACSILTSAGSASALTTADVEGISGAGSNDTLGSAQVLGTLPVGIGSLTVNGFISDTIDADVDFFQFTVAGGTVEVYFDIDLANDVGSFSDIDSGLDALLVIFNAAGNLIALNDDSDFFDVPPFNEATDPGSDPYGDLDPFIAPLTLNNGVYYAVVSAYNNDPVIGNTGTFTALAISGAAVSGLASDSTYALDSSINDGDSVFGSYRLDIRTSFAEITGVPGDTDGDADIDDTDLGTAFANYTGPVAPGTGGKTPADGDTDGDGDVDDTDLGTLFAGYTGPLTPAHVPEPASIGLVAWGMALCLRRRRRD